MPSNPAATRHKRPRGAQKHPKLRPHPHHPVHITLSGSCPVGRLRHANGRVGIEGMQRTEAVTFDEAFDDDGTPRPHYAPLIAALEDCDLEDLTDRVTDQLHHSGVTFGEGAPFRLDPVPRLVTAAEWAELEAGLAQRLRALNAFVDDVYGERRSI